MLIYLARHAWAGHYGDPAWPDDSQRPLTPHGIERYRRLLDVLATSALAPERVVSSPYVRCTQTAELISESTGVGWEPLEGLAIGADSAELLAWATASGAERVCFVGHNPDLERITARWIGDGYASIRFAKGSVAAVRFDLDPPAEGEGTLLWQITAKALGC